MSILYIWCSSFLILIYSSHAPQHFSFSSMSSTTSSSYYYYYYYYFWLKLIFIQPPGPDGSNPVYAFFPGSLAERFCALAGPDGGPVPGSTDRSGPVLTTLLPTSVRTGNKTNQDFNFCVVHLVSLCWIYLWI
jgi:hypothetical protein